MTLEHVARHQRVTLDDLNDLARLAGMTRRMQFDTASWNAMVDHLNERCPIGAKPLPRIRRGSILTSESWNRLFDRAREVGR